MKKYNFDTGTDLREDEKFRETVLASLNGAQVEFFFLSVMVEILVTLSL